MHQLHPFPPHAHPGLQTLMARCRGRPSEASCRPSCAAVAGPATTAARCRRASACWWRSTRPTCCPSRSRPPGWRCAALRCAVLPGRMQFVLLCCARGAVGLPAYRASPAQPSGLLAVPPSSCGSALGAQAHGAGRPAARQHCAHRVQHQAAGRAGATGRPAGRGGLAGRRLGGGRAGKSRRQLWRLVGWLELCPLAPHTACPLAPHTACPLAPHTATPRCKTSPLALHPLSISHAPLQNAGKSSLINAMRQAARLPREKDVTTAPLPGTTLGERPGWPACSDRQAMKQGAQACSSLATLC